MYIQIGIFAIIAVISILIGVVPSKVWMDKAFNYSGYYFICGAFFLWCCLLFKLHGSQIVNLFRDHYLALFVSIFTVILIFINSPPQFKILADETNLIGVSMSMYQEKTVLLPISGFHFENSYLDIRSQIDRRPLLFPLLVSFAHTLFGYSPNNGFVVNFFASVCLLFIFYLFLHRFFSRFYAFLSIPLLASLPGFVMWSTSSGFELLNMLFVVVTFHIFHQFLIKRDRDTLEILFLTLVLLANCRYESAIMSVIIFCLVPFLITKQIFKRFSPIALIIPILYIPCLWQRFIFLNRARFLYGQRDIAVENMFQAFTFQGFLSNAYKNVYIFMGLNPRFGFSAFITMLALLGLYLGAKQYLQKHEHIGPDIKYIVLFGGVSLVAYIVILFSYFWGDFSNAVMNRGSIVFIPYIIFCAVYAISKIRTNSKTVTNPAFYVFGCIFHLLLLWPYGVQKHISYNFDKPKEYRQVMSYLSSEFKNDKILIVSDSSPLYVINNRFGSVGYDYFNKKENRMNVLDLLKTNYDHFLIFQRYAPLSDVPFANNKLKIDLPLKLIKTVKSSTQSSVLKIFRFVET